MFPNLCFGKYLLVETEDESGIVPGKIEDAYKETSVEDKDDHDADLISDPAWVFGPSPARDIHKNNRYKQGCHKHKCNG